MAAGFAQFMQTVSYQHPTAPVRITAKGDRELAVGEEVRETRATGELTENRWSMLWTFSNGKVSELKVLEDTVEVLL
jgi:ketosteroid isomerase-like protein